jgi:hypothetical protein
MPKPPSKPATDALEAFADALEAMGIDPRSAKVSLPLSDWQHLARMLDDEGASTTGDIGRIELGGVRYSRLVTLCLPKLAPAAPRPTTLLRRRHDSAREIFYRHRNLRVLTRGG